MASWSISELLISRSWCSSSAGGAGGVGGAELVASGGTLTGSACWILPRAPAGEKNQ